MKKVLYLSNIQVPYRVRFFNQLAEHCDLTVVYERSKSGDRDEKWSTSIAHKYKVVFLDGFKIGDESTFSFSILKYILGDYDEIVVGCYSTPVGIFANMILRLFRRKFFLNFDGEIFAEDNTFKSKMKRLVINGATKYLIAGEKSAESLKNILKNKNKKIFPYYFSSLSKEELSENKKKKTIRDNYILVVGQYFEYKGLDIAVKVAKELPQIQFKFVGMGKRTELFVQENAISNIKNITVIPFLQKEDLEQEYRKSALVVLPSRRECWGLVINEATSFGTPIVATKGSGAGIEFLKDKYSMLLADIENVDSLKKCIIAAIEMKEQSELSKYLVNKSSNYTIEHSVQCHLQAFNI
ncbi:MAG: glycosyltransferase family 4 protein [Lachnospiraceae bacterium]|nr:glycosyltransferase family 4 protein [Lachnospiraceae bacterium]